MCLKLKFIINDKLFIKKIESIIQFIKDFDKFY